MKLIYTTLLITGLSFSTAKPVTYEPTFTHFASHEANRLSSPYDLSAFGIVGGALPKVYDIRPGQNHTYLPDKSYATFLDIKAGRRNRTTSLTGLDHIAAAPSLDARACNAIQMDLSIGSCYTGITQSCVDHSVCYLAPANSCAADGWDYAYVYSVQSAYITFWTSRACNGDKGSVNPNCNTDTDYYCNLDRNYKSFRIYSGCHSQYGDDGCASSGPA